MALPDFTRLPERTGYRVTLVYGGLRLWSVDLEIWLFRGKSGSTGLAAGKHGRAFKSKSTKHSLKPPVSPCALYFRDHSDGAVVLWPAWGHSHHPKHDQQISARDRHQHGQLPHGEETHRAHSLQVDAWWASRYWTLTDALPPPCTTLLQVSQGRRPHQFGCAGSGTLIVVLAAAGYPLSCDDGGKEHQWEPRLGEEHALLCQPIRHFALALTEQLNSQNWHL